jgi:hypothetical protein
MPTIKTGLQVRTYLRLDKNVDFLFDVFDLGRNGEPDDRPVGRRPHLPAVEAVQRVQTAFLVATKLKRLWGKIHRTFLGIIWPFSVIS